MPSYYWPPVYAETKQEVLDAIAFNSSTGLISGCNLTVSGTNPARFNMSAGWCQYVDCYTDPLNPVLKKVYQTEQLNMAVQDINLSSATAIAIDEQGNLFQSKTKFTSDNRRKLAPLGTILHLDGATVTGIINISPNIRPWDVGGAVSDILYYLGSQVDTGNEYGPNGANLKIDKSAGYIFGAGLGGKAPSTTLNYQYIDPLTQAQFFYVFRNGSGGWSITGPHTDIQPNKWDNGSGTPATVIPSRFTNQHITLVTPNQTFIQFGQKVYTSLAESQQSVLVEPFVTNPELELALFRSHLCVGSSATALNDVAQALFIPTQKLGSF